MNRHSGNTLTLSPERREHAVRKGVNTDFGKSLPGISESREQSPGDLAGVLSDIQKTARGGECFDDLTEVHDAPNA